MRKMTGSAAFFRSYFRCSSNESNKFWNSLPAEERYQYLSELLQWDDEALTEEHLEQISEEKSVIN